MNPERIKARLSDIRAWHDIEKTRRLDDLEAETKAMSDAIRARCQHTMQPWEQWDCEMFVGWVTHWQRTCAICGKPEHSDTQPEGQESFKVVARPQPF